jgi:dTDP-4-dehydrorhamnose 3,5-epimerase
MSGIPSRIDGVTFSRLGRHADSRGGFAEAWRAKGMPAQEPFPAVQANLSQSMQGVLRGLHLHRRQSDLWIVVSGVAFVALVDVRPMLASPEGQPVVQTATLGRDETVVIPPYVAHGFLALEPLELLYLVTNEYDASDELGFLWNDPSLRIEWPRPTADSGPLILSERDLANPPLRELVSTLTRERQAGAG